MELSQVSWLNGQVTGWQKIFETFLQVWTFRKLDKIRFESIVEVELLLLFNVKHNDNLAFLQTQSLKVLNLLGPETNPNSLDMVPDHYSNHFAILICPHLLIRNFLLESVHYSNHIHKLRLNIVELVFPVKIVRI